MRRGQPREEKEREGLGEGAPLVPVSEAMLRGLERTS